MKKRIAPMSALVAIVIVFCGGCLAQEPESKKRKTLRIAGKVTLILAKGTAKASFETVKFAGKHIVVPAVKNVGVPVAKAAPGIAKATVKFTWKGVRKGIEALSDDDESADCGSNAPPGRSN